MLHVSLSNSKKKIIKFYRKILNSPSYKVFRKDNVVKSVKVFNDSLNQIFFGYYDLPQFDVEEKNILALKAPLENTPPVRGQEVKIGYYPLDEKHPEFVEIAETESWCWQQGCRLQWYPGHSDKKILYNAGKGDESFCEIRDIETGKVMKKISRPLYCIDSIGEFGLSVDFCRLNKLRPGYGYLNSVSANEDLTQPVVDDGIWRINIKNGEERLLISLSQIMNYETQESMKGAKHYFNHLLFSPSGKRFMFFHLWQKGKKRFSRLFTSDINGEKLCLLNSEGPVSHYTWKTDSSLLVYGYHQENDWGFYLYEDLTLKKEYVGKDVLLQDGHPSFLPDNNNLILDTYPDRWRNQSLYNYDIAKRNTLKIGTFYSPFSFHGEVRCDLHPRVSKSGKYICVDTPIDNKRGMVLLELNI